MDPAAAMCERRRVRHGHHALKQRSQTVMWSNLTSPRFGSSAVADGRLKAAQHDWSNLIRSCHKRSRSMAAPPA
jgi:hypothetical protein